MKILIMNIIVKKPIIIKPIFLFFDVRVGFEPTMRNLLTGFGT